MKKILVFVSVMLFAVVLLTACGSANNDIVGTWRLQSDVNFYLVFNEAGTGYLEIGELTDRFEWDTTEAGTVMIVFEEGEQLAASADEDELLVGVLNLETPSGPIFWGEPDIFYRVNQDWLYDSQNLVLYLSSNFQKLEVRKNLFSNLQPLTSDL